MASHSQVQVTTFPFRFFWASSACTCVHRRFDPSIHPLAKMAKGNSSRRRRRRRRVGQRTRISWKVPPHIWSYGGCRPFFVSGGFFSNGPPSSLHLPYRKGSSQSVLDPWCLPFPQFKYLHYLRRASRKMDRQLTRNNKFIYVLPQVLPTYIVYYSMHLDDVFSVKSRWNPGTRPIGLVHFNSAFILHWLHFNLHGRPYKYTVVLYIYLYVYVYICGMCPIYSIPLPNERFPRKKSDGIIRPCAEEHDTIDHSLSYS